MFQFALQNVLSKPVRTSLAVIGMTVAIMGMVGLFSIAEGLDQAVGNTLDRAPGFVAMQRGAPIPLFSALPKSWVEELESIPGVRAVSPECWARANVIDGQVVVSPPRLLCGSDIIRRDQIETGIYRDDIVQGRYLNQEDLNSFNCVVSLPIAEQYNKKVGDSVEVNGNELTIVGIYQTGSILLDVAIIIDDNTFRKMTRFNEETVSSFYIEKTDDITDDELIDRIQDHFRGRGPSAWQGSMLMSSPGQNPLSELVKSIDRFFKQGSKPASPPAVQPKTNPNESSERKLSETKVADDPMEVRLATDWAGRFEKFAEDLDIALGLLTSLGIIIAVVSVVNTMLMSVSERMSEFGILRANGWSRLDLVKLIAWESFMLGLTGGLLGCFIGWGLTLLVNASFPAKFELYASPQLLISSLLFSCLLGVFSGLYPAIWAARMSPMDAIRRN
ncbi:MAG TPA: ABC transporter permease [Planctomycetaceae bacterium]|nr:ABC transporter permease [Planctomycetaceae bacterium]